MIKRIWAVSQICAALLSLSAGRSAKEFGGFPGGGVAEAPGVGLAMLVGAS